MNDPRHPLTPDVQETICAYIRAGGFPQVAAEAAGIPAKVFDTWMRYGNARRPQPLYRDFREAVLQAQAIARLCAETKAMERGPLSWLRFGPGRETKRVPGWTDGVKPAPIKRATGKMGLGKMWELIPVMLDALTPFPAARVALADALDKFDLLEQQGEMNPDLAPPNMAEPASPMPESADVKPPVAVQEVQEVAVRAKEQPPVVAQEVPQQAEVSSPAPAAQKTEKTQEKQPESGCEPATKVQPNGNELATKMQGNDSEQASSKPPPTPRKQWDPNLGLPDCAWTRIY